MTSWTQPLCTHCWVAENSVPDKDGGALIRVPVRAGNEEFMDALERCCKCGRATTSNIFIRVDPTSVPYPNEDGD